MKLERSQLFICRLATLLLLAFRSVAGSWSRPIPIRLERP